MIILIVYSTSICTIVKFKVSRKLAFVEDELEVAEDRVKSGDS